MRFKEPDRFSTMLVEQFRMHELIMNWSNHAMYEGKLGAHPSVQFRTILDLGTEKSELSLPLMFIDTAGSLMHEAVETAVGKNESKFNVGECDLVIQTVKELFQIGLKADHVGVISPYSA